MKTKPAAYDPVARARFDLGSELIGSMKMFTIADHDPAKVADAVDPVLRRRNLENAKRILAWLHAFTDRLTAIRDDAATSGESMPTPRSESQLQEGRFNEGIRKAVETLQSNLANKPI
jgi:hypothetical protein